MMRILVVSSVFPSAVEPSFGVFVKERIVAISKLPGVELSVVSPTPYVPRVASLRRRYIWWQFPYEELYEGIRVLRPRYPLPPKLGGYFHSQLMYPSVARLAGHLWREKPFQLIDSHFVYPNGPVAAQLARKYGVPFVVTGRGEDMLRFPSLPIIGTRIRQTLQGGAWCVALSDEIAKAFVTHGSDPSRTIRIPNGVDLAAFRPLPKGDARGRLNLPESRRIIISVGNLQERKGFHLLLDALPSVIQKYPDALLVIVGGPAPYGHDYSQVIVQRIQQLRLEKYVRLAGRQAHNELAFWYSAADIFVLLSSREGSPNVLLEALSCGTPAIATAMGGISEELKDERLGLLLAERSASEAAKGLISGLSKTWDRNYIRKQMENRSWERVARSVRDVFCSALEHHQAAVES